MREILFRGKTEKGEWVFGDLLTPDQFGNGYSIVDRLIAAPEQNVYDVVPDTVGQYTGLTDKNGTKIFEGDIVVVNVKGRKTVCKVAYAEVVAHFQLWQSDTLPYTPTSIDFGNYTCEVIGNIYDNPELLRSDTE